MSFRNARSSRGVLANDRTAATSCGRNTQSVDTGATEQRRIVPDLELTHRRRGRAASRHRAAGPAWRPAAEGPATDVLAWGQPPGSVSKGVIFSGAARRCSPAGGAAALTVFVAYFVPNSVVFLFRFQPLLVGSKSLPVTVLEAMVVPFGGAIIKRTGHTGPRRVSNCMGSNWGGNVKSPGGLPQGHSFFALRC
jgi:hypothetical protein